MTNMRSKLAKIIVVTIIVLVAVPTIMSAGISGL